MLLVRASIACSAVLICPNAMVLLLTAQNATCCSARASGNSARVAVAESAALAGAALDPSAAGLTELAAPHLLYFDGWVKVAGTKCNSVSFPASM